MIYEHFHKSEQSFVDRVLDWKQEVLEYGGSVLTPFLDKREQSIVYMIFGEASDFYIKESGGFNICERARLYMAPSYIPFIEEAFEIVPMKVSYPAKYATITHRDVLGSLIGLGLKREKFGDIHIKDDTIQFVVTEDVAAYVTLQLDKIGRTKVKTATTEKTELFVIEEEWQEKTGTVSSLRLDALLSEIFHISRQKASSLITAGKVKCNFKIIEASAYQCSEGDLFSVRGYGRASLLHLEGVTKKEKIRIKYGILK